MITRSLYIDLDCRPIAKNRFHSSAKAERFIFLLLRYFIKNPVGAVIYGLSSPPKPACAAVFSSDVSESDPYTPKTYAKLDRRSLSHPGISRKPSYNKMISGLFRGRTPRHRINTSWQASEKEVPVAKPLPRAAFSRQL